jgi:hypothetical protein
VKKGLAYHISSSAMPTFSQRQLWKMIKRMGLRTTPVVPASPVAMATQPASTISDGDAAVLPSAGIGDPDPSPADEPTTEDLELARRIAELRITASTSKAAVNALIPKLAHGADFDSASNGPGHTSSHTGTHLVGEHARGSVVSSSKEADTAAGVTGPPASFRRVRSYVCQDLCPDLDELVIEMLATACFYQEREFLLSRNV